MITEDYKVLNKQLHEQRPDYGSTGGKKWAQSLVDLCEKVGADSVLDYGCGKASLSRCMPMHKVTSYDPCLPGFDARPEKHDVVACLDVMEHVEPEHLDSVINDIYNLTNKAALIVISTVPAKKTLPDGRNTHLIIKDYMWWITKFAEKFELSSFVNLGSNIVLVLGPIKSD